MGVITRIYDTHNHLVTRFEIKNEWMTSGRLWNNLPLGIIYAASNIWGVDEDMNVRQLKGFVNMTSEDLLLIALKASRI